MTNWQRLIMRLQPNQPYLVGRGHVQAAGIRAGHPRRPVCHLRSTFASVVQSGESDARCALGDK